jgi:hypothetical protein
VLGCGQIAALGQQGIKGLATAMHGLVKKGTLARVGGATRTRRRFESGTVFDDVARKHLNNRIESDHVALKWLLRPMRDFRDIASAKATLKGIETFPAIREAEFDGATRSVAREIAFRTNLLQNTA